jgi:hypothetical protein
VDIRAAPVPVGKTSTPSRRYYSRSRDHRLRDLLPIPESGFVGPYSFWAFTWGTVFATVPFAYIYIALTLIRELCRLAPEQIYLPLKTYVPLFARLIDHMQQSSQIMEWWCWLEGLFFIACKMRIKYMQTKDPLEASLSAAPMMELHERATLWKRMMACEDDLVSFLSGWFFDEPIENISKYDMRDFTAWSMYEGRHQEHLTAEEQEQLESFVEESEWRISLNLYGEATSDENDDDADEQISDEQSSDDPLASEVPLWRQNLAKPKKSKKLSCWSHSTPWTRLILLCSVSVCRKQPRWV